MAKEIPVTIQTVLLSVQTAIMVAWEDTRGQVMDFDWRIQKTCFGQFLLGNVMRRVYELNASGPSVHVELKPNERKNSYHVELSMPGFLCTISAVGNDKELPRHADFRATIARSLQSFFSHSDNEVVFKFSPPPALDEALPGYIQILHGPVDNGDRREELGFIRVAFLDRLRGEQWRITTIAQLLEALSEASTGQHGDFIDTMRVFPAPIEEIQDRRNDLFTLPDHEVIGLNEDEDEDENEEI